MMIAAIMLRDHHWEFSKTLSIPHHELISMVAALGALDEVEKLKKHD